MQVSKQFPISFGWYWGGGLVSAKLKLVDCKADMKLDGELLDYGVAIANKLLETVYVKCGILISYKHVS